MLGGAAVIVMGSVVACTTVTGGSGRVDGAEAPAYRSSVAVSVSESAATSSMKESERQATLTTEAIHTACETLSTTSADAVDTVNVYVDAVTGAQTVVGNLGAGITDEAFQSGKPVQVEVVGGLVE